jgi:hypothetical protein
MNTKKIVILMLFIAVAMPSKAQSESTSKFSFQFSNGFGTTVVSNEGIPTRLVTSSVEFLGSFKLSKDFELCSGASLLGLNGNGFNSNGNYNQSRGVLRIPVLLNSIKPLNERTSLIASGGLFVNRILDDTFMYLNSIEEVNPDHVSMGIDVRLGITHYLYSNTAIGVAYRIQNEFSSWSTNSSNADVGMSTNCLELFVKYDL